MKHGTGRRKEQTRRAPCSHSPPCHMPTIRDMDQSSSLGARMRQIELRRVVITGLGVVSPNARGRLAFDRANRGGRSGITRIEEFDTSRLKSKVAGTIRGVDLTEAMDSRQLKRVSRMVPLAILASLE